MPRGSRSPGGRQRTRFPLLGLLALAGLLLPFDPASPLAHPVAAGFPAAYLQALPQQFYLLIKAVLPWVPLGLLAGLGLHGRVLAYLAPAAAGLLLLSLPLLPEPRVSDLLYALYALPGVALGIWLSRRSLPRESATKPAAKAVASAEQVAAPIAGPTEAAHSGGRRRRRRRKSSEAGRPKPSLAGLAIGALLLGCALAGAFAFSRWQVGLAAGLLLYAGLLWRYPRAWLVAVPAALPLLDLAPWSGRFFLDEFDLLLLATAGVLLMQRPARRFAAASVAATSLYLLLLAAALLGVGVQLSTLPALDANAFSSYWSPYNGLRVAKGFVWGGLIYLLLRRVDADLSTLARLLGIGMAIGLFGVGLVGLWERWLFAGFADADKAYRIVATFSSMHTGGGHIEAYLVAALPFLWLASFRLRQLAWAAPLMLLVTAVLVYTVSRGGVLALGIVLAILAAGSLRLVVRSANTVTNETDVFFRQARRGPAAVWGIRQGDATTHGGKRRRLMSLVWRNGLLARGWLGRAAPLAVLLLLAGALLAGIGGGYFQKRLAQVGEDWQTRVNHWNQALALRDETLAARLFGMGLGSFPRIYLERGPAEAQAATYGFVQENDNTFLRIGSGDTLYYAQRVDAEAGQRYRLELDLRSRQEGDRIAVPLCEKQMLDSRNCVWSEFQVPGDGQWRRYTRDLDSGRIGAGGALRHPPVELFLHHPGRTGVLDVDNLRLLDAAGRDLLCNGGFSRGADCWFFKTHSHLPWHIKNLWVHLLFEQGWLGLALFGGLTLLALTTLARAAWGGEPLAWTLSASLAGLLTVGMFDSLLDAPRLASLLLAFLLLGGGLARRRPAG